VKLKAVCRQWGASHEAPAQPEPLACAYVI
jgi:hypothetical protein